MDRNKWIIPVLLIVVVLVLAGQYALPRFKMAVQDPKPVNATPAVVPPPVPDYEHPPLVPELGGIRLNMTEQQVTAILGNPVSRKTIMNGAVLEYKGLTVSLAYGKVTLIRATAPGWKTTTGFEVGQTYGRLWELLKIPDLVYAGEEGLHGERIKLYFSENLEFGVSQKEEIVTAMWIKPSAPGPFPASSLIVDPSIQRPVIRRYGREYVAVITPAIRDAIEDYNPTFTTWRFFDFLPRWAREYVFTDNGAPFAVVGDFNGDKVPDMVLYGHTSENSVLLSVLSDTGRYRVVEIEKRDYFDPRQMKYTENEYGLDEDISLVPAGTIESPWEDDQLVLETDAFHYVVYGKAAMVYYYKDGKWEQYTTGD